MQQATQLYIVYNADAGVVALLLDVAKKAVGIEDCPLCEITHSAIGEKRDWKQCRRELGVPMVYVHRNEIAQHPVLQSAIKGHALPLVAVETDGRTSVLLDTSTLAQCKGEVAAFRRLLLDRARDAGIDLGG